MFELWQASECEGSGQVFLSKTQLMLASVPIVGEDLDPSCPENFEAEVGQCIETPKTPLVLASPWKGGNHHGSG